MARFELQLLWHRVTIEGDDRVLGRLRQLIPDLGHPVVPQWSMSYTVERVAGGFQVDEEGDRLAIGPDVDAAVDAIYVRAYRRAFELASRRGWVRIHAVTADVGGRRMLLVGPSGVGKTTLALHLVDAGEDVQGDESVLVRAGDSLAVPRGFHVKQGGESTVPSFAEKVASAPRSGDVAVLGPGSSGAASTLHLAAVEEIVLLDDDGSGVVRSSPVAPPEMLQALLREAFVVTETKSSLLRTLVDTTSAARGRRITRGPLGEMLDALRR